MFAGHPEVTATTTEPEGKLSAADNAALAALEPKLDLVRTRVRSVIHNLSTGLYLWGEGGTSKSFTVIEELKEQKANYIVHNSRMTGRGLVDMLGKFPSAVHVIEDCESMLDDKRAWGVLRSALWSLSTARPMQREVTWSAFNVDIRFIFTGAIVLIANANLDDQPELRAVASRIEVLNLVASFAEIAALMRSVALRGYTYGDDYVTPDQCLACVEYILMKMRGLNRTPDMRVYVRGIRDFILCRNGQSKVDWTELIETSLHRSTILIERRADRTGRERQIAVEIAAQKLSATERLRIWKERSGGKSERAYFRRLAER